MTYSESFKSELRKLYPDDTNLHEMAERGDVFLGRYLDDSCGTGIPIDTILCAVSLEELQNKARLMKAKVLLYNKWSEEYNKAMVR